jgi:excisionase family DNA binding protein
MDRSVEKLLYSRRDTAEALSLSIRSIDYLITTGRLPARRVGGKILIPASAVRRFAREDHPDSVRSSNPSSSVHAGNGQHSSDETMRRFLPQSEGFDSAATFGAKRLR